MSGTSGVLRGQPVRPATAAPRTSTGRVEIDPDWLLDYADRVDDAAEELNSARGALNETPLTADSFGELGRSIQSGAAYQRAAQVLREQLDRASEVLAAAATGLRDVVTHYQGHDQDSAAVIAKSDHR
ncbi:type VII secretion target [Goodfellowiella coeruleoviolacea]|nr:type VII secretion target [Goodfellowiella coeruleoviolacea]